MVFPSNAGPQSIDPATLPPMTRNLASGALAVPAAAKIAEYALTPSEGDKSGDELEIHPGVTDFDTIFDDVLGAACTILAPAS